jgi:phosphoribosylformimino-5-aminoimidazole carboxamide ribotide isomerase
LEFHLDFGFWIFFILYPMLIIPAVDVLDGHAVRLQRGERARAHVYHADPLDAARRWADGGARFLHLVNLNGAFGEPVDLLPLCARLAREVRVPFQVGGGIRGADLADRYLAAGAARVVVGTSVVQDPGVFREMLRRAGPERVVVAVDVKEGKVALRGWTATADESPAGLAAKLKALGVARLLVTDVGRDGMLSGPNVELTREVARAGGIPVIASGGISRIEDLHALRSAEADGIEGVIVGKALYEGRIRMEELRDFS